MPLTTFRPQTAVALVAVLAACSDLGTEGFDPMGSSTKAQEAFTNLGNNSAVENFAALQSAFTFTGAPPVLPPEIAASSPNDVLPAGALGKTFEYNPQTAKYASSDATGAPANGARFVLYEIDAGTKDLKTPLAATGYLDLTNESTPSPNSVGVKAVLGNATVVDYKSSGSALSGLTVTAKGNVSSGTGKLDFDLSQSFSTQTGIRIDYKVSTATPAIAIQTVATQQTSSNPTMVTLTVTEGQNKLEVAATGTDASVSGTVKYNGHDIARITGSGDAPVFTGQSGRQLSPTEIDGLKQLFDFVDVLFEAIDDLLIPAYVAFGFTQ